MLRRELGRGGTAIVFEAEHLYTGRIVALKLVAPDLAKHLDDELRTRMLREARGLGMVKHPSVVDVIDAGMTEDHVPFVAMEMLQGRTLEGILAARIRIDLENTVAIGLELCSALSALHRQSLIHRDVKPGNIFIVRDGAGNTHIKLMDLGIALGAAFSDRKLTRRGEVVGTLEYMSMERLAGDDAIDPRGDVYAAGVTMFECLVGDVPFTGSLADVVRQVMPVDARPVRLRAPGVPMAIAEVIEKACARTKEHRYASIDELADALRAAYSGGTPRLTLLDDAQSRKRSNDAPPDDQFARRKHPRAPYATPVRLACSNTHVDGRSEDISAGGMLVISRIRPNVNDDVIAKFALPIEGRVASVHGKVRWVRAANVHGAAAVGVEFVDPDSQVVASIERYVEVMSRLG
jgi:serine/threonine-protein kinase